MTVSHRPRRIHQPLCVLALTLALAACQTVTGAVIEDEEVLRAASPTNIASLSDVVRRNPNDPQAYNMRGSVYGRARRYEEALEDFNRAIQLDPEYAQAYANRAIVYREMKRPDLALADLSLGSADRLGHRARGEHRALGHPGDLRVPRGQVHRRQVHSRQARRRRRRRRRRCPLLPCRQCNSCLLGWRWGNRRDR